MSNHNPANIKTRPWQKLALVIFGVLLTLILLEVGLRLSGFIILSLQEYRNMASIRQRGEYRIMCLGESTTQNQYPRFLEEILNQRDAGIKFSVIDKGRVGTTTPLILAQLELNLDKYQPNMVVTMMGINDGAIHMPYETVSNSAIIRFFRSFRTYKLARLLWLHILTKTKGIYSYKILQPSLLEFGLNKVYAEELSSTSKTDSLKKAIELGPKTDWACIELGGLYHNQGKLSQAEDAFNKAIELNPYNDRAYAELVILYQNQDRFSRVEDLLKKAAKLNFDNDWRYSGLGWLYWKQGKFSQAEEAFKKAIELNPYNDRAYIELAILYHGQGKFSQAEDSLKKAIELGPKTDWACIELGGLYHNQGKLPQAEKAFKKAIELNPYNNRVYAELVMLYQNQGKFSEAEDLLKQAIKFNPDNDCRYAELGFLYRSQGKFFQAERAFKKAIELNPQSDVEYGAIDVEYAALSALYQEMGKSELAEECERKMQNLRLNYYNPVTVNNYHKLKEILDKRGIILVCVQYPMRSIEPLKKMFQYNEKGIIFVDNKKVFKDAVKMASYKEYFIDMFGGDFGHCTPKGNRLLAENIANVILSQFIRRMDLS